ncbi:MAG: DNA mismatch repair protein MutS [Oscillospiraceae bacterium]|nr:DNA mismatch repair protein MutS [Oscillospiraceae bacterium]
MAEITPMMRQYLKIKEEHSDCILFFRLGDFYEMFNDDAKTASKELDLVLTTRDRAKENPDERVPMCGVPYHSAQSYIARLIAKGYKVAICEQTEDPALAKGLVDREVVKIITPGTVTDPAMLEEGKSNYICCIALTDTGGSVCFADISTGEMALRSYSDGIREHIVNELARFSPAEAVLNGGAAECGEITEFLSARLSSMIQRDDSRFDLTECKERFRHQFGKTPEEMDITSEPSAVLAVGGLLSYIIDTQKADIAHINTLDYSRLGKYMELDYQTVRNMELVASLRTGEKKGSLLWVLDKTGTAMGSRMIRSWITRPLLNPAAIRRRQNGVSELVLNTVQRSEIMHILKTVGDMERIMGKVAGGSANARDLTALSQSAKCIPQLKAQLHEMKSSVLQALGQADDLGDLVSRIDGTLGDDPPFSIREGGMIRPGFSPEVDRLRGLLNNSSAALQAIETRERERTGKKLKIGFNKVFGYYIEMPRSAADDVPEDYIRKQTLVNNERFITQELKELENELLTARDRLGDLEFRLFSELRDEIAGNTRRIQRSAQLIAMLDVLCSLAHVAAKNNYCMPEIDNSRVISVKDGRHPVVELTQTDAMFVPNDTEMGPGNMVNIITGPNMAGKSTYMRQTALIVLMAQIGSFVPARDAHIGIVDRVFTRIGASDDLSAGKSTFMVEMTEVAEIMKNATADSLLILDEIGRGTSTYDGMSVARAILEYCAKKIGAKTMFATHYHELTDLEGQLKGVKNYHITAKKRGGELIFLRKIVPGSADDSYGVEVASLAGVPEAVTRRAGEILRSLESGEARKKSPDAPAPAADGQLTMGDLSGGEIADTLRKTDLNTLTPLEALNLLFELKKKL